MNVSMLSHHFMSYMKKTYRNILIGLIFTLLIVVICFIWYYNNQSIKLTVVKESYSMLAKPNQSNKISINLYVNQKESYMTNKEKINSCYLHSYSSSDTFLMNLEGITLVNQTSINKEQYYVYTFTLAFKMQITDCLQMPECYLLINYSNSKSLDILIGSLTVNPIGDTSSEVLNIKAMKGITKRIDNILTLEAIALSLTSSKEISITSIELLDLNLYIQNYKERDYNLINNSDDIDDLFGSYNFNRNKTKKVDYTFNDTGEIVLELGYLEHYEINAFPIRINYTCEGSENSIYVDTFVFFINNNRTVKYNELVIYEYEYN